MELFLGLKGDGYSFYELKQYADDIRDDLIKLDDASEVEISGIQDEQIYVEFENSSLAKLGLTAGQLQSIIASTNIVFPGGEVSLEDERIVLEPTGNYEAINDLKKYHYSNWKRRRDCQTWRSHQYPQSV